MKKLLAASVVALLSMPFAAGAASEKGSSSASTESREFDRLDKNKDGYLSRDEVKGTEHDKDFAKLDKNNDGKLSRQEHGNEKSATGATSGTSSSGTSGSSSSRTESK
jgi:hypothetical protein